MVALGNLTDLTAIILKIILCLVLDFQGLHHVLVKTSYLEMLIINHPPKQKTQYVVLSEFKQMSIRTARVLDYTTQFHGD